MRFEFGEARAWTNKEVLDEAEAWLTHVDPELRHLYEAVIKLGRSSEQMLDSIKNFLEYVNFDIEAVGVWDGDPDDSNFRARVKKLEDCVKSIDS